MIRPLPSKTKTARYFLMALAAVTIAVSTPRLLRAQDTRASDPYFDKDNFRFTQVIDVPGKDQGALYRLAAYFAASNARTPREKVQIQDKSSGRIILTSAINVARTGIFSPDQQTPDYVLFTAILDTKNEKARIILENFIHYGGISAGTANAGGGRLTQDRPSASWFSIGRWNRTKRYVREMAERYLEGFKAVMQENNYQDLNPAALEKDF